MYSPPLYENLEKQGYGALGNKYFKLFNIEIARAITSNTRFYLHLLSYRINEKLQSMIHNDKNYVIYNDTDSVYFQIAPFVNKAFKETPDADIQLKVDFVDNFVKRIIDPLMQEVNEEFSKCLNAFDGSAIQVEREAIASVAIHLAKKKYIMRVYDNEGTRYQEPKKKIMGVEIIRSSTPKWAKKYLTESIDIIMDSNRDELKKWIDNRRSEFPLQPIEDITRTTSIGSLSYSLTSDTFKDGRKIAIPINSRAALSYNRYLEKNELDNQFTSINVGDKVKISYMRQPNPTGEKAVAFIDPQSVNGILDYVDHDTNFEKYFLKPLDIMVAPLEWNLNKNTGSLDDW